MKIQIENLKAQMRGVELNIHQLADALIEFNKLLDYTENLETKVENLGIHGVTNRTYKCSRCGTEYIPVSGIVNAGCCTMPSDHRTSGICGGELVEIT